jgi:uncharacterized protein with GYD domain
MPKYLYQASYTAEGLRGVLKDGAAGRKAAAEAMAASLGGKLEAFYFAFGSDDVVTIVDVPDNASAAALSLTVSATGLVRGRITPLLTVEEADKAIAHKATYRGPGTGK